MDDSNIETFLHTIFDSKDSAWKPSDVIPLVNKEIEKRKADLKLFLHNNVEDLSVIIVESKELCQESKSLVDDMQESKKEIEEKTLTEIVESIEFHDKVSKELEIAKFSLDIIGSATQCGKLVKDFNKAREAGYLCQAMETAYILLQLIDFPTEGFDHTKFYENTKEVATRLLDSLLNDLFTLWDSMISFSTKVGTEKTIVTLKLNTNDETKKFNDILNALEKCEKLNEKISELAQFIMKEVIDSIIHYECTIILEGEDVLLVHIVHKANQKPNYKDVLDNLRSLFLYLSQRLSIKITLDCTLVQMVGKQISTVFTDMLVRDCLIDTIPNNIHDLSNYNTITLEIRDFQSHLANLNVYPEGSFAILGYVDEIEVIFAKKASQHFLDTARTIMLKDLSVSMSIGVENIPEDGEGSLTMDKTIENALKILDNTIPESLFYFPRCMISKSAQELLDFVNDMMEQTVQCSQMLRKKNYFTIRMVFELYDAVVPYYHEKYLQTIPQYIALFHNNCMYLAHNLQLLGDKWRHLMDCQDQAIGFLDLVQPLRDLGYKHLAAHLQYQRKQILDNIRSSDLNSMSTKDSLGPSAEAALRQCLRQLALLKSVWIGVLPHNVFANLMGTLTNMFVVELIHRVVTVEDISAEMATQLSTTYSLVVQKAPSLFQNPSDLVSHVKSWPKLHELIFVLGGTLKDLEAHWADGSGPLAQHFTTDELRNLIKALFQNTQFRANLLSKIK